jgi:hypothetical protein
MGVPDTYDEKVTSTALVLSNYRAELPTDFLDEIQVIIDNKLAVPSSDTYIRHLDVINKTNEDIVYNDNPQSTYKIAGNYIYSSKKIGNLTMNYKALMVDANGTPLIPDDNIFVLALKAYIELEFLKILFRSGKTSQQVLSLAQQDYAWAVGRYDSHSKKLNVAKMEQISRLFRGMQIKTNEYSTRFKNFSVR